MLTQDGKRFAMDMVRFDLVDGKTLRDALDALVCGQMRKYAEYAIAEVARDMGYEGTTVSVLKDIDRYFTNAGQRDIINRAIEAM